MDSIRFQSVVPHVFAHADQLVSEVWAQELCLDKGKTYLIEADSGKGKSTFCSYIIGYRRDFDGKILFDLQDVAALSQREWVEMRRYHVSHLFQELRLFPELTALENVMVKNSLTGFKPEQEIRGWFELLGIEDKIDTPIGLMSFGQQQRVAMMRALAQPFDFLLADEPISHLDETNSARMAQLMMDEAHKQGAGVIVTSIGKHMVLDYDHIYRL